MIVHTVPNGVRPVGLARYLSRAWPMLPDSAIRAALRARDVRINGARSGGEAEVRGGDELKIYIDDRFFDFRADVIFDDGRVLCVDKPAGLPVDVDRDGIGADTLISRVRALHPAARLCHRLDEGTGGCVLCALDGGAEKELLAAFKRREVGKAYQAVLVGCPEPREAALTGYLVKCADASRVRVIQRKQQGALPIETRYRVIRPALEASDDLSLVELDLITGRTHQIRAHMASIGHPLLGDDKYGDRDANKRFRVRTPQLWCVRLECGGMSFESLPKFALSTGEAEI